MIRKALLLVILCLLVQVTTAQNTGGQFCVRAFQDTNSNQIRDPGEPFLAGNISVNLMDSSGAIILTGTLEDSANRASGLVCFNNLPEGQYTVQVLSAIYRPTTPDSLTTTIAPGQIPALLEYGAQPIAQPEVAVESVDEEAEQKESIERLIVSMIGSFTAVLVMSIIGLLLFAFVVRPRAERRLGKSPEQALPEDYMFRRPGSFDLPDDPFEDIDAITK